MAAAEPPLTLPGAIPEEPDTAAVAAGGQTRGGAKSGDYVVLLKEQRAEEWHFDDELVKVRTAALGEKADASRCKRNAALAEVARLQQEADEHASVVCSQVALDDARRARELAAMREELAEVQEHTETILAENEETVCEIEREIMAERGRRAVKEQELRDERKLKDEIKQRMAENEDYEAGQLRQRDQRMRDYRQSADREVQEVHRQAAEQIRKIEQDAQAMMDMLMADIRKYQQNEAANSEVKLRLTTTKDLQDNLNTVDNRIMAGRRETNRKLDEIRDQSLEQLKEVQARDFAHEGRLKEMQAAAFVSIQCAEDDMKHAVESLRQTEHQRAEAVKLYNGRFHSSKQFNLRYEDEMPPPDAPQPVNDG
eukprot:TRINITY_DN24153_c0_g1_i1.p1 TRINITY_DN24153_c0_g1~~TRINITY_DN24153_c0_g1_i1.p1  ORF type:complete len:369 (-),score=129.26 TRINITY_DN24153_c0_g1_i1:207-1313(-)